MKALDKRQKTLLAGLLAAVVFIVVLLLIPVLVKEKPQEESSVVAVIPEADLTEGDDSKTASYRNGNISDYWDELGKDNPEPVSPDIPGQAPTDDLRGKGSRRPPAMEVDDIFGDYRHAPAPEAGGPFLPRRQYGPRAELHPPGFPGWHKRPGQCRSPGRRPSSAERRTSRSRHPDARPCETPAQWHPPPAGHLWRVPPQ